MKTSRIKEFFGRIGPYALSALLAGLGVWGLAEYGAIPSYDFVYLPVFVGLSLGTFHFWRIESRRMKVHSFLLGFAFSLSFALGYQMQRQVNFGGVHGILLVFYTGFAFAPSAAYLFSWLYRQAARLGQRPIHATTAPKKVFLFDAAILFCAWLPVFLAFFPGIFAYDVNVQLFEILSGTYTNFNPILHTLLIRAFYAFGRVIGSYTLGMMLYTLFQMTFLALVLAYALCYLYKHNCPRGIRLLCLLFFAFFPTHALLAISITKDVFFSAFLLLSLLWIYDALKEPLMLKRPWCIFRLVASIAAACFFRNSGYAIFLLLGLGLFLLLFTQKALRNRLIAFLLCGLALFWGGQTILMKITHAEPGPLREALSVPIQQISRVYALHEELDCRSEIEAFLPKARNYNQFLADDVKSTAKVDSGLFGLWLRLMKEYPSDYLAAFLTMNRGYWFIGDVSYTWLYTKYSERVGYLSTYHFDGFGVEHASLLPALEEKYADLVSGNQYQAYPVFALLFHVATYTWLLCFLIFSASYAKRRDILSCCFALLALLLLFFFGPGVVMRYVYPLMLGCPILFGLLFGTGSVPPVTAYSNDKS